MSPAEFLKSPWLFVLFGAMWLGGGAVLARASGWRALAERFRSARPVDGERFRFVTGWIGASKSFPVQYRGALFITISGEGFLLSIFFPFRLGSPPLFIPWTEVESVTEEAAWFVDRVVVRLRDLPTVIRIAGRAGQRMAEAYALSSRGRSRAAESAEAAPRRPSNRPRSSPR
jgi:hypothetical protein